MTTDSSTDDDMVIDRIFWETELNKYVFHVVYTDGDNEELEL